MTSNKILILWADVDVNTNDENVDTQKRLSKKFGQIEIYDDEHNCRQFIRKNSKNDLFLIVSGRLSRQIVPAINHLDHVLAIYIYCGDSSRHIEWAKGFSKIRKVIIELDDLISTIKSDLKLFSNDHNSDSDDQDSSIPLEINTTKSCHFDDYRKMPLGSLEEATKPLHALVDGLDQMVWIAKDSAQHPAEGLTADESASIVLYTMAWYSKEESFAFILNKTLRKENTQQIKPWFRYLKLLFSACSKLKTVSSTIYYGTTNDVSSKYPEGQSCFIWEFMNCTDMIETVENDDDFDKQRKRILISIQCQTGKDIRQHAHEQCPYHILLLPGRQFQVLSCDKLDDKLTSIQLTEMKSPYTFE